VKYQAPLQEAAKPPILLLYHPPPPHLIAIKHMRTQLTFHHQSHPQPEEEMNTPLLMLEPHLDMKLFNTPKRNPLMEDTSHTLTLRPAEEENKATPKPQIPKGPHTEELRPTLM